MKTLFQQYHETKSQIERAKPRSERRILLTGHLRDLMTDRLKNESDSSHRVSDLEGNGG